MNKTQIEWVKNPDGTPGYTWNPITGCLNGCEYCYARRLANGRLKSRYLYGGQIYINQAKTTNEHDQVFLTDPFYPRFWPERLEEFERRYRYIDQNDGLVERHGIFVCDMSDLFGIGVPEEWTGKVMEKIWGNGGFDRFYLLTKQPRNLIKWSPFPDNCWVGVSATDSSNYIDAISGLAHIEAKVKYISLEPLLASCDQPTSSYLDASLGREGISWVIIGSCTGSRYELLCLVDHLESDQDESEFTLMPYGKKWTLQPPIDWVKEIVEACDKAGIPVFLKDNLMPLILKEEKLPIFAMKNWQRGKAFELRQELPGEKAVSYD